MSMNKLFEIRLLATLNLFMYGYLIENYSIFVYFGFLLSV